MSHTELLTAAEPRDGPPDDWRTLAVRWLSRQSVETVLLFGILLFVGYMAIRVLPSAVEAIKAGYRDERSAFGTIIEAQRQDAQDERRLHREDQVLFRAAIDRLPVRVAGAN